MVLKIYKYNINPAESLQMIEMPEGAEILAVKCQYDKPKIWAMVDPSKPNTKRCIEINITGGNIPSNAERKYIDTCLLDDGDYVIHVFELIRLL